MGIGTVDLRIDLRHDDDGSPAHVASIVTALDDDPAVAAVAPMVTTRNRTVDRDGNAASLYVENGDHTAMPLTYADGRAPTSGSEIALSLLALHEAGREVGATLPLEVGGQERDLTIVGSYQDVTNGGKTAKSSLPTGADEVMWYMIGIQLAPGADATEVVAAHADQVAPGTIADIEQWRAQTLGPIAGQITVTAIVSAVVAIVLAVLMTALFTRMLLARDVDQIAIQRALGADDPGLRRQYLTRILLVLVLGVVVGTVAANTVGRDPVQPDVRGDVRRVRDARPGHEPDRLRREPVAGVPAPADGAARVRVRGDRGGFTVDLDRRHLHPHHRVGAVMTTATAVLDAQGLTKAFDGTTVLHGLDLQVRDGEFVSVMGPSGSGKSTLLYNISGMDTMTAGSVSSPGRIWPC
jgi:hypothetical protein